MSVAHTGLGELREIPVSQQGQEWIAGQTRMDTHVHSPAPACQHSHPVHPAMGDFTACPELKHKYGNYTGREGIPVSSRLKNNSRFMKHKGKFTNEQGLSRKALKQGRQCLCLPKCRKRLGSCRTLSSFVQAHAMLNPLSLKI